MKTQTSFSTNFFDFQNFVKLTYATPYLHHSSGTVCEPTDIPVNKRHLDMVYAHLKLSNKPFMGGVTSPERARDSIEMAKIVFGSDFMETNAVMQGNINVNSPFIYDDTMSGSLRVYAEANQCVCVSPAIFGGAMGPVTPAAIAAQTLAEGMVGIALSQLVRPSCPAVLGSFHSTMNLRTGSLTFGTPEANLVTMALSQLGHRLGVPVRSGTGGQVTAANTADGQAMQDSANGMWATMLSGTHQVWHAAGWLEGGLSFGYEKFINDIEGLQQLAELCAPVPQDTASLGWEALQDVQPGGHVCATQHTMERYETAFYSPLVADLGNFGQWTDAGEKTSADRATEIWKRTLADFKAPPTGDGVRDRLQPYIEQQTSKGGAAPLE